MSKLDTLIQQRNMFADNPEVCAVLDRQIAELQNIGLDSLEVILEQKIQQHKMMQERTKRLYAQAKADLDAYGKQLKAELEASLDEINALKEELSSQNFNQNDDENSRQQDLQDFFDSFFIGGRESPMQKTSQSFSFGQTNSHPKVEILSLEELIQKLQIS